MKQWTLVQVEWVDSHETSGWQFTKDIKADARKTTMAACTTVGFVYDDRPDSLVIVGTYADRGEEDEQVIGMETIPKAAIRRIRRLAAP